ncbi:hypothetical protein AOQ84DRAFT_345049 [Glonium stellatum]|uniref:DUF7053 domain-containing protein n=1 Tax=Glonium stellatum TaxID=574774 RepID=A0A8E2JPX7_9PEZI|nr:hypothetical protein AOQ84DRAFT_345049 [Glonium stellatum]
MMRKKTNYTNITPIPSFIPRQLAIDILHSHSEIIELNPLVIGFEPIKAPRDAPSDEFYSTWYEITERLQFIPGTGKMGQSKITFKGCFHDMPWGLQTHIYAPMSVDLRNKWKICGNQPGEPPETRELGLGAPAEGLYLREDIEIKCNFTMISFVKKELKASSKVLVDRLIKKAELLDSGALQAMMENGKLKTVNPADRSSTMPMQPPSPRPPASPLPSPLNSPKMQYQLPRSPTLSYGRPAEQHLQQPPNSPYGQQTSQGFAMELPGDYYHPGQESTHLQPPNRYSMQSEHSGGSPAMNSARWSGHGSDYQSSISSRPTSYASDGIRSPGLDQKAFAAELPTVEENIHTRSSGMRNSGEGGDFKQDYAKSQDYGTPPRYRDVHSGQI